MLKKLLALWIAIQPAAALADQITDFKSPQVVRETITGPAISLWVDKDMAALDCPAADCCPDTAANDQCTGSGTPVACCTGVGTGTCNHDACVAFAVELRLNPALWAPLIEEQYQNESTAFACNTWFPQTTSNTRVTACTTVPATPLIRIADICSRLAGKHFSP